LFINTPGEDNQSENEQSNKSRDFDCGECVFYDTNSSYVEKIEGDCEDEKYHDPGITRDSWRPMIHKKTKAECFVGQVECVSNDVKPRDGKCLWNQQLVKEKGETIPGSKNLFGNEKMPPARFSIETISPIVIYVR
jgi:hypothetical protein